MSSDNEFRTSEQEVLKLLEECVELRRTLKSISAQLGRMENRVKRAFPDVAAHLRMRKADSPDSAKASITTEQALAEFERVVGLVTSGKIEEAEKILEVKSASDLFVIAKELGVSFSKSKPSVKSLREAVFGKVRESVLLTRHHRRT